MPQAHSHEVLKESSWVGRENSWKIDCLAEFSAIIHSIAIKCFARVNVYLLQLTINRRLAPPGFNKNW